MPTSKHRKNHKQQLNKRKTKQVNMSNQNPANQLPEVRSIPTWSSDAKIEITGVEWEAIQSGLTQVQIAQQASQAVMSRNLINGQITLDYEKLDPSTLTYVPMTDEEKAPLRENFEKALANARIQQEQALQPAPQPEGTVQILDSTGEPAKTEPVEEAKVISITGS